MRAAVRLSCRIPPSSGETKVKIPTRSRFSRARAMLWPVRKHITLARVSWLARGSSSSSFFAKCRGACRAREIILVRARPRRRTAPRGMRRNTTPRSTRSMVTTPGRARLILCARRCSVTGGIIQAARAARQSNLLVRWLIRAEPRSSCSAQLVNPAVLSCFLEVTAE